MNPLRIPLMLVSIILYFLCFFTFKASLIIQITQDWCNHRAKLLSIKIYHLVADVDVGDVHLEVADDGVDEATEHAAPAPRLLRCL